MIKKLAIVKSVAVTMNDRDFLTFHIDVDYEDGCSQLVGSIILDAPSKEQNGDFHRIGTAYGCEMIRRLFLFFGVQDLALVKNQYIYVLRSGESFSADTLGIENINVPQNKKRLEKIIFKDIYDLFN